MNVHVAESPVFSSFLFFLSGGAGCPTPFPCVWRSQPREMLVISSKFCGHLIFQFLTSCFFILLGLTAKQKTPSYFVHHDDPLVFISCLHFYKAFCSVDMAALGLTAARAQVRPQPLFRVSMRTWPLYTGIAMLWVTDSSPAKPAGDFTAFCR